MLLLDFINNHKDDWQEMFKTLGIVVKQEGRLTLLKYNMQKCDFSHKEPRLARGIIIQDIATPQMKIVSRPFDKFFNIDEEYAAAIDWESAKVQSKRDGSLVQVWYNELIDKWQISTSGTIDAFKAEAQKDISFGQLFLETLQSQYNMSFDMLTNLMVKGYTYMFELCTPQNRIVINYGEESYLWHIGTRNVYSGAEIEANIKVNKPHVYNISGEKNVRLAAVMLNQEELTDEGFVVVDKNWNRVKVKNLKYVTAHYYRHNNCLTASAIYDILLKNEVDEYLSYFPENKVKFEKYQKAEDEVLQSILKKCCEYTFVRYKYQNEKLPKWEAEKVLQEPKMYQPFIFSYINGNKVFDLWDNMPKKKKIALIEKTIDL